MEPTCVSVFVWHVVPSRLRRQRLLLLFTQASQQRAFAFSGGNHRQSLRSRRDADPPLWLRLPTLLLPSPLELLQFLSTHLLLLDSGFCGWYWLPGWRETRWGRSSVVHPSLGNSNAGRRYCESWYQQLPWTYMLLIHTSQDNQISMKMLYEKD